MKIKVVLIRHGKTQGNLNHEYIGKTDESLCDIGIKELNESVLKNPYPQVDFIYTSPLKRCIETANIIYNNEPVIIEEGLRECDFGDFEKMNYEQLKDKPEYQHFIDSNGEASFPNGESRSEFSKRCVDAFDKIIKNHNDKHSIAIVCHGGTIMAVMDMYSYPHEDFYNWQAKNTQGYSFIYDTDLNLAVDIEKLQGEK